MKRPSVMRLLAIAVVGALMIVGCGSDPPDETVAAATTPTPTPAPTETPTPDVGPIPACEDVPNLTPTHRIGTEERRQPDRAIEDVVDGYVAEHRGISGGWWYDRSTGTFVLAFTDDPAEHLDELATRLSSEDASIGVVQVPYSEADLRGIQDDVSALFGDDRFQLLGAGVGPLRNRVTVRIVDPTPEQVAELAAILPPDSACLEVETTPQPPDELALIPGAGADPLVQCIRNWPFRYSAHVDPTPLEEVDHPAAEAMLAEIDESTAEAVPPDGWILLAADDEQALFARIEGETWYSIAFAPGTAGWVWDGSAVGGCELRVAMPEGLNEVEIGLDPDFPAPAPADTALHLLVSEVACAGGEPVGDRLLGPQVVETPEAVLIAFAALSQVGAFTCPSHPATPVTVELAEPLGDRVPTDGLSFPPEPLAVLDDLGD